MTITRSQAARLSQSEGPGDAEPGDAEEEEEKVCEENEGGGKIRRCRIHLAISMN